MSVINIVILSVLFAFCSCDVYWVDFDEDNQLLVPHEFTGEAEEHSSDVWKSCTCQTTFCSCNAEFRGWNNRMLNFNIMNDEGRFKMEIFDDKMENKQTLLLEDGLNCRGLHAGVFDIFCVKPYGNISNPYYINVCIQLGLIIEKHHAIALEYQCFKSDNRTFNHTGVKFESPDLSEFNHFMFTYYKTSSAPSNYVSKTLVCFLVLFTIIMRIKDS